MNEQTKFAVSLIEHPSVKSVLNIGFRYNSDMTIPNYCKNLGKEFDILEIYKQNCDKLIEKGFKNVYNLDCRDIKSLNKKWDLILWLHGPEHIKFKDFINIREDIEDCANKFILYQAPIGDCQQDEIYENPYEKHVERLYPEMFEALNEIGFRYITAKHRFKSEFTFSALRIK